MPSKAKTAELHAEHLAIVKRVKVLDEEGDPNNEREGLMLRRLQLLGIFARQQRKANCEFCKKYPEKCN